MFQDNNSSQSCSQAHGHTLSIQKNQMVKMKVIITVISAILCDFIGGVVVVREYLICLYLISLYY